jgi:hypothetical protein
MRVRVRFRYNAISGEVEFFEVDELGGERPLADHDTRHDRIAAELAGLIERDALITEALPGLVRDSPARQPVAEGEAGTERERRRDG